MLKRAFQNDPGQIRFTEDFQQQTRGCLQPGKPVDIEFADVRIPNEPTGKALVEAGIQFDGEAPIYVPMVLRNGWRTLDSRLTERGEGNLWMARFIPPAGCKEMQVWFVKTGPSGQRYYDSSLGKNYRFRFPQQDFEIMSATVGTDGFSVEIQAVPEITAIEIDYQILNAGTQRAALSLQPQARLVNGKKKWIGSCPMAKTAVVSFAVIYTVDCRTYKDCNQRRGFLAPDRTSTVQSAPARRAALFPSPT
jgi:hypothetical protein